MTRWTLTLTAALLLSLFVRIPSARADNSKKPVPAARWVAQVGTHQVDVTETMNRIALTRSHSHKNDGTLFQNKEKRLPQGHSYLEFVVPTPGVSGAGPRRIVVNEADRAWFTPDHYSHFYPVVQRTR